MIVTVENLSKEYYYYKKQEGIAGALKNIGKREKVIKKAVDNISFSIEQGNIIGLLGPNGAGKTTTLKMLSGILYPSSGTISVNGYAPWERKKEFKRYMSIVLGNKSQLWTDLPAVDSFEINRCIYDIPKDVYKERVSRLAEMLQVAHLLETQVRRLSLGEKMKLEFIASMLHYPQFLLLDEPTIGLDLISQKTIRKFITGYNRENNATIIITSHYTADIEALCKRVIIINNGAIAYDGQIDKIDRDLNRYKIIMLKTTGAQDIKRVSSVPGIVKVEQNNEYTLRLLVEKDSLSNVGRELFSIENVADINIEEFPIEDQIEQIYKSGNRSEE
jgi:ABC-2 type transport system ATP-binding protein